MGLFVVITTTAHGCLLPVLRIICTVEHLPWISACGPHATPGTGRLHWRPRFSGEKPGCSWLSPTPSHCPARGKLLWSPHPTSRSWTRTQVTRSTESLERSESSRPPGLGGLWLCPHRLPPLLPQLQGHFPGCLGEAGGAPGLRGSLLHSLETPACGSCRNTSPCSRC